MITSAKILFPNKVIFTDSREFELEHIFLGGMIQSTTTSMCSHCIYAVCRHLHSNIIISSHHSTITSHLFFHPKSPIYNSSLIKVEFTYLQNTFFSWSFSVSYSISLFNTANIYTKMLLFGSKNCNTEIFDICFLHWLQMDILNTRHRPGKPCLLNWV